MNRRQTDRIWQAVREWGLMFIFIFLAYKSMQVIDRTINRVVEYQYKIGY